MEWYIESFLRSVPAQSTNISWPSDWHKRRMQTAWLRELTEFASVAHVARLDCAICAMRASSSGERGKSSAAPSAA